MFKKPLSGTKTSAPLRSSDRRKLKQRVVSTFGISPDDGDILVPDGIQSMKFITHLDEPGIAYLSSAGDPLWFTLGKSTDDELVPTVYTLWKRRDLLPILSTPAPVIPVLIGGADLMIPGVVHHAPSLRENQLVSIVQYNHSRETPTISPPLAVGRMALPGDMIDAGQEKGKAVYVLHTWKDHLWEMGSKGDVPEPTPIGSGAEEQTSQPADSDAAGDGSQQAADSPPTNDLSNLTISPSWSDPTVPPYTPQEITSLLHISLLQAISTSIPASSFPIPATIFYTNHILPSRPAFPASIVPHSGPSPPDMSPCPSSSDITIKSSTHKSLTTFLKAEEKSSLLTLKAPQKHSQHQDVLITSVNLKHPSVAGHHRYVTVKDVEATAAKKALKEEKAKELEDGGGEVEVTELWKPHQATTALFEGMGGNTTNLYSLLEAKTLLNSYISSKSLVNPYEQAYINLDPLLVACVSSKSKGKSKGKDAEPELKPLEFMRREELTKAIMERMQSWYEVRAEGRDPVRRKGTISPIHLITKVRQGRKASTLISGFEPFLVVNAEDMAEELRKVCAGATSVAPIPGKPAGSGLEVLVQGKQSKAVVDYLTGRGIPKKWIEVQDLSVKK
ncbi:Eukaryotic translation initiation factor 2D [Hypsizygus marmoreus]|uniref:Eukaryotic translation initiation factor 2D n=1 Tax=Hypsizygus marmoreus TaxID=39966 RepID=A0A369J6I2_HYPMA|nr:Eukaryotic translation initiation factor 2D [Hypsizygus marmoreus]